MRRRLVILRLSFHFDLRRHFVHSSIDRHGSAHVCRFVNFSAIHNSRTPRVSYYFSPRSIQSMAHAIPPLQLVISRSIVQRQVDLKCTM